ncbi:MAG: hypothetical protein BWY83_02239 [bacterium ADurb.Bin478]|nr:MAG: hypothetical protein BWY83_02239 [bacterium ADurb.Bin478]
MNSRWMNVPWGLCSLLCRKRACCLSWTPGVMKRRFRSPGPKWHGSARPFPGSLCCCTACAGKRREPWRPWPCTCPISTLNSAIIRAIACSSTGAISSDTNVCCSAAKRPAAVRALRVLISIMRTCRLKRNKRSPAAICSACCAVRNGPASKRNRSGIASSRRL